MRHHIWVTTRGAEHSNVWEHWDTSGLETQLEVGSVGVRNIKMQGLEVGHIRPGGEQLWNGEGDGIIET